MAKKKASEQRYRIMGDGSGHKYFIPIDQEEEFEGWVASFEDATAEENYEGPDFEANRIDGTFTFTDPRCS